MPGDVLSVFAEIYDNGGSRERRRLEVKTSLVDEAGAIVFTARDTLGGGDTALATQSAAFPLAKHIPLAGVRPGRYRLRLETSALGGDIKPVSRETDLSVVAAE